MNSTLHDLVKIDIILLDEITKLFNDVLTYNCFIIPRVNDKTKYSISMSPVNIIFYYDVDKVKTTSNTLNVSGLMIDCSFNRTEYTTIYSMQYKNIYSHKLITDNVNPIIIFDSKDSILSMLTNIINVVIYFYHYDYRTLFLTMPTLNIDLDTNIIIRPVLSYNAEQVKLLNTIIKELSLFTSGGYLTENKLTFIGDMYIHNLFDLWVVIMCNGKIDPRLIKKTLYEYCVDKKKPYSNIKTISPLIKELNLIVYGNNDNKVSMYEAFIKKYNIVESNTDIIYDSNFNELLCPHVRDSFIYNKEITQFHFINDNIIYCRICGGIISNDYSTFISINDELPFYSDINYNDKQMIWYEIIKLLSYITFIDKISQVDVIKQLVDILCPVIQRDISLVNSIKTLVFMDKYIYIKVIMFVYIWCIFILIKKKYPDSIDITIVDKHTKTLESDVLNRIIQLQSTTIRQHQFITKNKLTELFYNGITMLSPSFAKFSIKKSIVISDEVDIANNVLYTYLNKENTNDIIYNNLLNIINLSTIPIYENSELNSVIVETLKKYIKNITLCYKELPYVVSKESVSSKYSFIKNINSLAMIYGIAENGTLLHKHKWIPFITHRVIDTFKCSICNIKYKEIYNEKYNNVDNILKMIDIQQLLQDFYTHFFILCPEGDTHEFTDKWICKKCSITPDMLLNKDNKYFIKYRNKIIKQKKNITDKISISSRYIMPTIDKSTIYNSYEQSQRIHKIVKSTSKFISVLSEEQYINFLTNLGGINASLIVKCDKLYYYLQSIVCICLGYNISVNLDIDYNKILMVNSINDVQYILLFRIYDILMSINNKECLMRIISMIINYEITIKQEKQVIDQFNIKDIEVDDIVTDKIYDEIDYDEVPDDEEQQRDDEIEEEL